MNKSLYLIDASIYVFRSYYSLPTSIQTPDGEMVNAVYGYAGFLLDLLSRSKAVYVSAAFDESLVSCYRNRIYPAYKANRGLPDRNLEYQIDCCLEFTELLGVHCLSLYDYEADDIIGTLAKRLGHDRPVVIVTRDKDLGQLLREEDLIWDFADDRYLTRADVEAKMGVRVGQIADFLALAGDSVDNIPGAPGIGAKTARILLEHFGSLDRLLDNLDAIQEVKLRGAKRVRKTLAENLAIIRTFQEITKIHLEVPMETIELEDLAWRMPDRPAMDRFLDRMGFGGTIRNKLDVLAVGE